MDDLRTFIGLKRLSKIDDLIMEDQEQVKNSHDLQMELVLNQEIEDSMPSAPPIPNVESMLTGSFKRAELIRKEEQANSKMQTRSTMRLIWQGAFAAILLLAIIGFTVLYPGQIKVGPSGLNLRPEAAWAVSDGFILEMTLDYNNRYTGTIYDSEDHPLWQLQVLIDNWAMQHVTANPMPFNQRLTTLEMNRVEPTPYSENKYRCHLKLTLISSEWPVVHSLIDELSTFENLSEPTIRSKQFYLSEKFPNTHYLGRKVIINGQTYLYPTQISADDLPILKVSMHMLNDGAHYYYALADIKEFRKFQLSDIVRLRRGEEDELIIDNLPVQFDIRTLDVPSWNSYNVLTVSEEDTKIEIDPVKLFIRQAESLKNPFMKMNPGSMKEIVVDLLPYQDWLGVDREEFKSRYTKADIDKLNSKVAVLDDAIIRLLSEYIDLGSLRLWSKTLTIGDVPVQWEVHLPMFQSLLLEKELDIAYSNIDHYGVKQIPSTGWSSFSSFDQNAKKPEVKEIYSTDISWYALPQIRWEYIPFDESRYDLLKEEFSTEEIENARNEANRILNAVESWIDDHPQLNGEIAFSANHKDKKLKYRYYQTQDIYLGVNFKMYSEDETALNENVDALINFVNQLTNTEIIGQIRTKTHQIRIDNDSSDKD